MSDDPEVYLRAAPNKGGSGGAFDSKKWLWVPDAEQGFAQAQVLSTKGDKVTVELPNGSVSEACMHRYMTRACIVSTLFSSGGSV